MSEKIVYIMKHPTVSKTLNDLYQAGADVGFHEGSMGECFRFLKIEPNKILDVINEVNNATRDLRREIFSLRESLEQMESLHTKSAMDAKTFKVKAAHYEAASDARRALGKGDL